MLCQFTPFKNFKSYKETTTFDFQATSIPEFSDSLIVSEKGDALLPAGVVYGPNGGGKTNLLSALSCLISTVVNCLSMSWKRQGQRLCPSAECKCCSFSV